jgi:D-erythro-7,8-dihydroneopterin triphosphate epimerase
MRTGTIRIKKLRLRAIIGINPEERLNKQDLMLNVTLVTDLQKAIETDAEATALNYRSITKKIIHYVENSEFYLLEKLADSILQIVLQDPLVLNATVEVDKLHALRFSESVSVEIHGGRL